MSLSAGTIIEMSRFPTWQRYVTAADAGFIPLAQFTGLIHAMQSEMRPYFPALMATFDAFLANDINKIVGLKQAVRVELTNYPLTQQVGF